MGKVVIAVIANVSIIIALLSLSSVALAQAPAPAASLTLEYSVFGVGVGLRKGEGVISLTNGAQYAFSIEGASLAALGFGKVVAAGRVYNLDSIEDFAGSYSSIGAGFAFIVGPGVSNLKNDDNDVQIALQSTVVGLGIGLGVSSTKIEITRMIKGPTVVETTATETASVTPRMERKEPASYKVYFDHNSSNLNQSAMAHLATIVKEWSGHSAKVSLKGHTDTSGASDYNQSLSEKRAIIVQQSLIEQGIPAFRLDSMGAGETMLAIDTPDEAPNKMNRRVEIQFD